MPDILNTSITGLLSYQTALSVTSHNIANVGNKAYSRQDVELSARNPLRTGDEFIGQGVLVEDVRRLIDSYVSQNIREFTSTTSRMEIFTSLASRVENLVANDQGGLMPALDGFFNALNDVANDPAANAPRVALLGAAEILERQFVTLGEEMQALEEEADQRISFNINEVNALTSDIARLNDAIVRVSSVDTKPSDLLDQRDEVLRQLSEKMTITVLEQNDGTLNVLMGSGQLLVTGATSLNLVALQDPNQPDRLAVGLRSSSGSTIDLSNTAIGGEIGGLLEFRNNMLDEAQNRLGRLAIGLAETFNAQHIQGLDLDGLQGTNFFSTNATGDLMGLFGGDYLNNGFDNLAGETVTFNLNFDSQVLPVTLVVAPGDTNQTIAQNLLTAIGTAIGVPANPDGSYTLTGTTTGVSMTFSLHGDAIAFESSGGPSAFGNNLVIDTVADTAGGDATFAMALLGSSSSRTTAASVSVGGSEAFIGPEDTAIASLNNNPLSTGNVTYSITDITALTTSDYTVEFDGTNYNLRRSSDRQIIATSLGPLPLSFSDVDGMDITLGGVMNIGDSFLIRPTRTGAIHFNRIIDDPNAIAAASPVRSLASVNNIGNVAIASPRVTDATNGNLFNPVTITFDATASNIDVTDTVTGVTTTLAYTSGMTLSLNGWEARLTGNGQPGDSLRVEPNTAAATDNTNMLRLAGLQNQNFIDGGTASYGDAYSSLVSEIGTVSKQFKINLEVEQSLLANAELERQTLSGVNLDEEAANMIRFQQAYQAMTRVIQTAQTTFQTLLEVI